MARLDRRGLQRLAAEGGGRYFELDRQADRDIANAIIDAGRRSAAPSVRDPALTDVYWPLLAGAAALAAAGALFARRRPMVAWQLAGALAALVAGLRVVR